MALTSSPELPGLSGEERRLLLARARHAIEHGARYSAMLAVAADAFPPRLQLELGCFVTLRSRGPGAALRGCVGSLRPRGPLVCEVARSAHMAAFRDPRFDPVLPEEVGDLHIHISVLSQTAPIEFDSEKSLLEQLRPGMDGLVLSDGARLGTFLPDVWKSFPHGPDFLRELKRKAGMAPNYWSDDMRCERYVTEVMDEEDILPS
jgi:AmmeMemoRadiSam system protein A